MTFLGIGPGELILILILLLVVVGPERLPGLARSLGRGLVQVRNWLQTSPDAALVLRARQEIEQELATIRSSLLEVQSVRDEMLGVAKQLDEAVGPIANARTSLANLIKEPANKPLARTDNGQPANEAAPETGAAQDMPPGDAAPIDSLNVDPEPSVPTAPPEVAASASPPIAAHAPADTSEDLGRRIQALTAEVRALQAHLQAEWALKSAQVESAMADLHALQQQLKQRGLLDEDWQPPSWTMQMPGAPADAPIEEADR